MHRFYDFIISNPGTDFFKLLMTVVYKLLSKIYEFLEIFQPEGAPNLLDKKVSESGVPNSFWTVGY
jgi:hypothetical protein